MLTILFGLGTSVGYALHDFLMVKVVRAVSVWTALTWSMGTALVILLPLALVLDGLPSGAPEWRAAGFGVLSGLAEAAGLAALLRGLVVGRLSLVTPLASLSGGFAALIMILRGETITPLVAGGLALAVVGGMLASIERVPKEEVFGPDPAEGGAAGGADAAGSAAVASPARPRTRRTRATAGAGWALFSAVLFSVAMLLLAEAGAIEPVSLAAFGRIGTVAVMLPVALVLRRLLLPRPLAKRAMTAGIFDAAAFVCMAAAVTIGPVAVASVMSAQGGLAAAVLGFVFLRERLAPVQYIGVALTCAAVALLAAG
jgi:drug/metabolite transporter (DMT)-like permease